MNYRHAFHAGNFADVFKHAIFALALQHLQSKAAPLRIIDTHAGCGRYALHGDQALRTGEWIDGIGRLVGAGAAALPGTSSDLLAPYLAAVSAINPEGSLGIYPGSPEIAAQNLRTDDRLMLCELHRDDHAILRSNYSDDRRIKVACSDGWLALHSYLPAPERRALVLIDPPFERRDDAESLLRALLDVHKRQANAVALLWYPIKAAGQAGEFEARIAQTGIEKLLACTLFIRHPADETRLNGCGMIILNPPWQLPSQLNPLLAFLAQRLNQGKGANGQMRWLVPEAGRR